MSFLSPLATCPSPDLYRISRRTVMNNEVNKGFPLMYDPVQLHIHHHKEEEL